jgi:hypothetical protein
MNHKVTKDTKTEEKRIFWVPLVTLWWNVPG